MPTATMTRTPKNVRIIPAKPEFTAQQTAVRQLRVAAYCRVSTDKDEQQLSFEAQRDFYTDKIMKNPEWALAGIFADKGISGTSATKRPEFMKMIRLCKQGKIDLILTKSVQRFARNTVDSLEHVRLLKSLGIGVIFETQGLDTRKMTNEFLLTVYASLAQAESESISANVKWGKQKSAAKGRVIFSYANFLGYHRGPDGFPEIDPEQAEVVRRIYDSFLAGQSRRQIAEALMAEGIPSPTGKSGWSPTSILAVLQNEKYKGDALLQKTFVEDCMSHKVKINRGERPQYYVEDSHPGIIEKGVWNRVQEELARRGSKHRVSEVRTKTLQGKYSAKYALTELLVCGHCGTPYRRATWKKNGNTKVVWRCISRLDYGKRYCTESPTLEEGALHTAILRAVRELAQADGSVLETLKLHIGMGLTGAGSSGEGPYALRLRMGDIEAAIGKLIEREAQSGNEGAYDSEFQALYAEKMALKEKLETIRSEQNHTEGQQARLREIFAAVDGLRDQPLEWDEQVIRQLIEWVRVESKEKLTVRFRCGVEIETRME